MATLIVSDSSQDGWTDFLTETVRILDGYDVRGVAVIALFEQKTAEDDQALAAYYNMALRDKQEAASIVEADVTKAIVKANLMKMLQELEDEEDGDG